jgi:ABC-type sugar transport system ATPase subunit
MSVEHPPALRAVAVSKRFTATTALDAVDFDLRPGEVHGLVGENGAGKSTLVKVLTGVTQPSSGRVTLGDQPIHLTSPRTAAELGIAVVHQDNQLFEHLRVWEHLAVSAGRPTTFVRRRAARAAATTIFDRLDVPIDVDATAAQLAPTERKVVEIARALARSSQFLLLDEPTAALDPTEAQRLATTIRRLADHGTGVVLVSHHLEEVISLADRVTVLRDGRNAGSFDRGRYSKRDLVTSMIGAIPATPEVRAPRDRAAVRLTMRNERLIPGTAGCDLDVHAGEIVAVVGLVGSGVSTLLATVAGARRATGSVALPQRGRRISTTVDAVRSGVGYLPPDRKSSAILADLTVASNVMIGSLPKHTRIGFCSRRVLRESAAAVCDRLGVRYRSVDQAMSTLSGGNQQKALIGRWLTADVDLLVVDEPTQGVDVGARADIHGHLRAFADAGGSVLLASSDFDEVLAIADRIVVFRKGAIVHDLSGDELTALDRTGLLERATGLHVPASGGALG